MFLLQRPLYFINHFRIVLNDIVELTKDIKNNVYLFYILMNLHKFSSNANLLIMIHSFLSIIYLYY